MPSFTRVVAASAMMAFASAQGVITSAKGDSGTSKGLQVDAANTADANFISISEIKGNIVNGCGRTLAGNIDIGEQTELELLNKTVTQVKKGSTVTVTVSQRNANGTGPFTCDMDQTSNGGEARGLSVTQGTAADTTGDLTFKVAMPADMACIGASTGDICTVRCVNAAQFGGCFAVQQTDITPTKNVAGAVKTKQTLQGILAQIDQNKQDLGAAIKAVGTAGQNSQNVDILQAILASDPGIQTLSGVPLATATTAAAAATSSAAAGNNNKGNKGKNNNGAATGATNGAAKGNKNNNNGAAAANGKNNGAAAAANGKNNNKREEGSLLRWAKRYVVQGADFAGEGN